MNKKIIAFADFFGKERTMDMAFFCTAVIFAINMAVKLFIPLISLVICDTLFYLSLIFLYVSFKLHNKNVQKGLLGAVLMWYLYDEINYVVGGIILSPDVLSYYNSFSGVAYIVLNLICVALFTGLFVNHFIINSDRHSRPINIFINQWLVILFSVFSIISAPFQVIVLAGQGLDIIEGITWQLGVAALAFLVASYESRLDAYRIDREAAGWTEEAGYPEGYVHGYEKK